MRLVLCEVTVRDGLDWLDGLADALFGQAIASLSRPRRLLPQVFLSESDENCLNLYRDRSF